MKAKRISKFGFECPACGNIHPSESKLPATDAWIVAEDNPVFAGQFVFEEPSKTKVYRYSEEEEDCVGEQEPEYAEVWQCGECEAVHLDKDEAKECCR